MKEIAGMNISLQIEHSILLVSINKTPLYWCYIVYI